MVQRLLGFSVGGAFLAFLQFVCASVNCVTILKVIQVATGNQWGKASSGGEVYIFAENTMQKSCSRIAFQVQQLIKQANRIRRLAFQAFAISILIRIAR